MAVTDIIRGPVAVRLPVAGAGLVVARAALHRLSHTARRQAEAIGRIATALARAEAEPRD